MGSIVAINCFDQWMVVRFAKPMTTTSWAIANGGRTEADAVAWLFLQPNQIADCHDVVSWFQQRLQQHGLEKAVGLMTSRRLHQYVEVGAGTACHVVATVGLSNALSAGDPVVAHWPEKPVAGTINILCALEANLTEEAALEALALASEAKAAALLDCDVPSVVSGRPSTGTGTDCIVIAHPTKDHNPSPNTSHSSQAYCGKHTPLGAAIGATVREAVTRGVREWLAEYRP